MVRTFVLRVWGTSDPDPPRPARVLLERTARGDDIVATHDDPVDDAKDFVHTGTTEDLASLLDRRLANTAILDAAGDELYRRLAPGDIGTALARLGAGCRVLLDLQTPALEPLPWELLRRDGFSLFMLPLAPWSIGICGRQKPPALGPADFELPLRVLVVIGHEEREDGRLKGDDELRAMEDALQDCHVTTLRRVLARRDPDEIDRALRDFRPHVFHFVGHGGLHDGKPVMHVYSSRLQESVTWDEDRVRRVFARHQVPRLVILNACEAGNPQVTRSLVRVFLELGARFVIAMQTEINGSAALTFCTALYRDIAKGQPLDVAVAEARRQLGALGVGPDQDQWPIARLVVGGNVEALPFLQDPPPCAFPAEPDFVHRWNERHQAWQYLAPDCSGPRLLVVRGARGSGKSEFLKVLGETSVRCWNRAAAYVDLGGPLDLRAAVPGLDSPRAHVVYAISKIRDAIAKAMDVGRASSIAAPRARTRSSSALCADLRKALEDCAAQQPLLLLIDGLHDRERDTVVQTILPELCAPYLRPDPASRVRVVVALPDELAQEVGWGSSVAHVLRVGDFSAEEWRSAANQFIRWHRCKLDEARKRQYFESVAWPAAWLCPGGKLADPPRESYAVAALDGIRFWRKRAERI